MPASRNAHAAMQITLMSCENVQRNAESAAAQTLSGNQVVHQMKKTASSKERIIKAAAKLFSDRGYHAVGMTDLQRAVDLGRGSLYHHISSKEDLLYEIVSVYIHELVLEAKEAKKIADPVERIRMLGAGLVEKIATHQAELTVCFREVQSLTESRHETVMEMHGDYEKVWKETFQAGAKAGVFRDYDPVVLKGVLGMYYYSYLWIKPSAKENFGVIADRLVDLTLRMLKR